MAMLLWVGMEGQRLIVPLLLVLRESRLLASLELDMFLIMDKTATNA
jgi:hypothetical protein